MVGRLGAMRVLGLPGNPVSALRLRRAFPEAADPRHARAADRDLRLSTAGSAPPMPANDSRQDYVRARLDQDRGGRVATPFRVQDSSMLATLAAADALIVRPVRAPAAAAGERRPGPPPRAAEKRIHLFTRN